MTRIFISNHLEFGYLCRKIKTMSISNLYSSGFRKRNRDHFAAIVRVALSDGEVSVEEHAFIERLAKNLDIPETELKTIMKDPAQYPINPPADYESRLERLYDIARMVHADLITEADEIRIMTRLGIGLGFPVDRVDAIVEKSIALLHDWVDLETFKETIKKMKW